jgi:hypothetical protein
MLIKPNKKPGEAVPIYWNLVVSNSLLLSVRKNLSSSMEVIAVIRGPSMPTSTQYWLILLELQIKEGESLHKSYLALSANFTSSNILQWVYPLYNNASSFMLIECKGHLEQELPSTGL